MAPGITLNKLLVQHGKLDVETLWHLLYALAKYIHHAIKDPTSWKQGPVLLISSTKIILYSNGKVEIKCGSVGECDANLFQAPETHSDVNLANKSAVEQVYVYCLGMTMYCSAEWGIQADEEVELPDELDEVLIGMVQECTSQRIHLSLVIKICEDNLPKKTNSLKSLVKSYLKGSKKDEMESKDPVSKTLSAPPSSMISPPPPLPPPPPPPQHSLQTIRTLPKLPSIDTIPDSSTSTRSENNEMKEDSQDELIDEECPYATNALPKDIPPPPPDDYPYSTANELAYDLSNKKGREEDPYSTVDDTLDAFPAPFSPLPDNCPTPVSSTCSKRGSDSRSCSSGHCTHTSVEVDAMYAKPFKPRNLSKEASVESTVSDFENPYGTLKDLRSGKRIDTHDHSLCKEGKCSHTQEDIAAMYATVSLDVLKRKKEQQIMKENAEPNLPTPPRSIQSSRTMDSISSNEMTQEEPPTLASNKYLVIVQLLNKEKPNYLVERDWLVERVFKEVKTKLGIKDKHLFGLVYRHDGLEEFLPLENKLKQYAAEKWKPDNPRDRKPLNLEFRVKYFPPSPSKFKNGPTRLQYFYQLRQKIVLKDEYNLLDEEAMELAAITLQIDHGDYRFRNESSSYERYNYLPPTVFAHKSDKNVRDALTHLHGNLDGMSQSEAIQSYLQVAENLQDYGVHFIEVHRNSQRRWLGVSLTALLVYSPKSEEADERGSAPVRFEWNHIMNLSYKSKTFLLDVSVPKRKSPKRYAFETANMKISRNIMTMCADTHKFYLHIRDYLTKLPPPSLQPRFSIKTYRANSEIDSPGGSRAKPTLTRQDSKRPPPNTALVQKYVCLTKETKGQSLGMTIIGGDGSEGIYVDRLVTGGLANLDGRIKKGDQILSVNGTSLRDLTHSEAVSLIVAQPCRVELEIVENMSGDIPYNIQSVQERSNSIDVDNTTLRRQESNVLSDLDTAPLHRLESKVLSGLPRIPTSNHYSDLPTRFGSNAVTQNNATLQRYDSTISQSSQSPVPESLQNRMAMQDRFNLVRQTQQDIAYDMNRGSTPASEYSRRSFEPITGLPHSHVTQNNQSQSFSGGNRRRDDYNEGGERRDEGKYCDYNTTSNGSVMTGSDSQWSPGQCSSVSDMSESSAAHSNKNKTNQQQRDPYSRIFTVYLNKERGSLGMSIRVNGGTVHVNEVFPNGPASNSGMIEKGDAIISANGIDLTGMSSQEAISILQRAPANVSLVMRWGSGDQVPQTNTQSNRIGMWFQVTIECKDEGFGFIIRRTYIGEQSFVRVKSVKPDGPACRNGCIEEGDILLSVNNSTLLNTSDRDAASLLAVATSPATITVYRPDTIRTFNPLVAEDGRVLALSTRKSEELYGFVLCAGYPYYCPTSSINTSVFEVNDRLLRVGKICCQGIKSAQLQALIVEHSYVDVQVFRTGLLSTNANGSKAKLVERSPSKPLDKPNTSLQVTDDIMEKAESIVLNKKEDGLGFSLLGQQDSKRIVYGVAVKRVFKKGAAHDEGRLAPGDLIIMVNGRSMVGITQSKALSTIRKSTGEVVLTIVPGHKRDPAKLTNAEKKLLGLHMEKSTDM